MQDDEALNAFLLTVRCPICYFWWIQGRCVCVRERERERWVTRPWDYSQAMSCPVSHIISLSLSFLVCKMGVRTASLQGCCESQVRRHMEGPCWAHSGHPRVWLSGWPRVRFRVSSGHKQPVPLDLSVVPIQPLSALIAGIPSEFPEHQAGYRPAPLQSCAHRWAAGKGLR